MTVLNGLLGAGYLMVFWLAGAALARRGIAYVLIGRYERSEFAVNEAFYAAHYPVWYQNAEDTVYAVLPG